MLCHIIQKWQCKSIDTDIELDFPMAFPISLSSMCKLFWRHWTYKMSGRYILPSVCVRLSISSQLSIIQYMGLCVFSLPIPLVMIEIIYTLFYYHQIGIMTYQPLFRVKSWNNSMHCVSLYLLILGVCFRLNVIVGQADLSFLLSKIGRGC